MRLSERTREPEPVHDSVLGALRKWVEGHPAPDVPALSIAQAGQFSPRQLLQEVVEQTDTGQLLEEMIDHAAAHHKEGLEGVLRMFDQQEPPLEKGEVQAYYGPSSSGR